MGSGPLACERPEPPTPGDYGRHEGDGCGFGPSECADAHTLWACSERTWKIVDCDEACADHGGSVGCLAGEVAGDGARCWCEAFMPECAPGAAECVSDEEIKICSEDTLDFERARCDDLCGALTPPERSVGCLSDACRCTLEGTPCPPDSPSHCELEDLVRCVDGVWTREACWEVCGNNVCDPFAEGGAKCDC